VSDVEHLGVPYGEHAQQARAFQDSARGGCFVIPNPWDIGSARILEEFGFAALAKAIITAAKSVPIRNFDHLTDGATGHLVGRSNADEEWITQFVLA